MTVRWSKTRSVGRSRPYHFSRRRFLQFSTATVSSLALANCRQSGTNTSDPDGAPTDGTNKPLYIYTWSDYVDGEVYDRFTQATGIPIEVQTYDSNETMLAKIQAGGGQQFSILYPSDYMVQQMIELGLLATLDHSKLTGLEDLRGPWQNPTYDPNNAHSIPLSWGTTGLIYDTTKLSPPPADWAYLWERQDALTGRLTLLDDVRETLGATLASLGYSYNTTDPGQIEAAFKRLQELKPAIAQFSSFGWEDSLIAGDLDLCMTYSHLGNALPAEHPNLRYVIPTSGSSLWTDAIAIPKTAPNPEAAYAWLNFMLEPENAAFAVQKLGFATPSKSAFELLPAELQDSETLFPPESVLANCEGIAPLDTATSDLFDRYWTELTSA
ncbi:MULTISPECIES: ABC transporter substrate-binding protein [Cyanophyceae]|uniref:Spermidine/putrescine ABC transporter substrate-binding protein n=1 Tax=Leptolyngbya subtilissima DQ-A4 TaxID=2933933 RepID=A0ABV0K6U2_9CYAN|nr:spermidine/putrescine ABC transporter substrate-binding protein [Nodosilinea sp. FACHB-141]MBD2113649.1 spermidine/putrescine ABC transporter substrate-binding protein [Nodosilinea sp. FACHB-141]